MGGEGKSKCVSSHLSSVSMRAIVKAIILILIPVLPKCSTMPLLNKRQEFIQVLSGAETPKAFGAGIGHSAHEADIFNAFRSKILRGYKVH